MFNLDLIILNKIKEFANVTSLFNVPVGLLLILSAPLFYLNNRDKRRKNL